MNIGSKIMVTIGATLFIGASSVFAQDLDSSSVPAVRFDKTNVIVPTERTKQRKVQQFRDTHPTARLGLGKVVGTDGTSVLTVEKDGDTYTVTTGTLATCNNEPTQIRRRYMGEAQFSDILVGHTVNVIGKFTNDGKTDVDACLIRDTTIEKRHGVIMGTVNSTTESGFTMTTARDPRGPQTVTISGDTKLYDRQKNPTTKADILVGHKVRVRGVWDRNARTLTEVTEVRDFSLPGKPEPTTESSSE